MKKQYIERDALLEEDFTDMFLNLYDEAVFAQIVKLAPTADVEPVRRSTWRLETDEEMPNLMFKLVVCNECGKTANHSYNYCPNCGAKMDGDTKREVGFYRDPKNYNISQRLADGGNE